jgi:hypothetical protein
MQEDIFISSIEIRQSGEGYTVVETEIKGAQSGLCTADYQNIHPGADV